MPMPSIGTVVAWLELPRAAASIHQALGWLGQVSRDLLSQALPGQPGLGASSAEE